MKKSYLIAASVLASAVVPAFAFASCGAVNNNCGNSYEAPQYQETSSCNQYNGCAAGLPQAFSNQVQTGNIYARVSTLANSANGANLGTTSVGNAYSAQSDARGVYLNSDQRLGGNVHGNNIVRMHNAQGENFVTTNTQGNATQLAAFNGKAVAQGQQITQYGTSIVANNNARFGHAQNLVSTAQIAGNNWGIDAKDTTLRSHGQQYNSANINGNNSVFIGHSNGTIGANTIVAGNSNSIVGTNSTIYSALEQKNYGNINANTIVLNNSGNNVYANSVAVANNANLTNKWGYAQLAGYQENNNAVNSRAIVLNGDFTGNIGANAQAMGNSGLVSNIGSDARLNMVQNNFSGAPITAIASLSGFSSNGGVGSANSYAVGNALTGYTCAGCNGGNVSMGGHSSQYNYAPISATTNVNMATNGAISATATAIGNTASYIAKGR
jgi:hypothetical protein